MTFRLALLAAGWVATAALASAGQTTAPSDKADALAAAVHKGDAAAVTRLLDEGVDVNTQYRYTSEDGDVFVIKAGPASELLATNPAGEILMASPAIADGVIYFRGLHHVFAIGAPK